MRIIRAVVVGMALLALLAGSTTPASAELKVSIGGYVKLDAAYQDQINNAGKFRVHPAPGDVAFDEGPNKDRVKSTNDQFLLEARQTRLHAQVSDEVGATKLKGQIQFDLFGGVDAESNALVSSSHVPRLRHAWASGEMPYGVGTLTILAGQQWSTFMNIDEYPDFVDFNGPAGQLFARQPQLRVTYGIPYGKDKLNLIGAVQAQSVNFTTTPLSTAQAGTVSAAREEGQNVPAIVGKVQWLGHLITAEVAGIFSQAKGITPRGHREEADAYGLQGSVWIPIGPLSIFALGNSLNGLNREGNGDYPDAVFRGDVNKVAVIHTYGGFWGLEYKLTPTTKFTGAYGIRTAADSGFSGFGRGANARTDLVRQQTLHANMLQTFWKRFQLGLEYERQWIDAFRNNHGTESIGRAALWFFF